MTLLPVIERELRAEARSPYCHWLRLTSATAALLYFWIVARDYDGPASLLGRRLFGALLPASILLTLVLTPQLTADCLSREKREGTLGLLFLTSLTATEIVLGKSLVHLLRAMTVLAALSPFFAVPLLLGGVQGGQVLVAILANVAAALVGFGIWIAVAPGSVPGLVQPSSDAAQRARMRMSHMQPGPMHMNRMKPDRMKPARMKP